MTTLPSPATKSLDGTGVAREIRAQVTADAVELDLSGLTPRLALVVATDHGSSAWYVRQIARAASAAGLLCDVVDLGPEVSPECIRGALTRLSADPAVHGIMLQTPLPAGAEFGELASAIDPDKDIDGANPVSQGRLATGLPAHPPATAAAVLALLDHCNIPLAGRTCVVVGHSTVVGRPVAQLLLRRDATVTVCHRHTENLEGYTRTADVLVVAVGRPGLITARHVDERAVVVDVGTTPTPDGGLAGDVDHAEVDGRVRVLTPVPGGVGPVTTAQLLRHAVQSAAAAAGRP